jgi:hypothetical protein
MPTIEKETVLIGNGNNGIFNLEYSSNGCSVIYSEDLGSPVAAILYGEETNKSYISTNDYLYIYDISSYTSGTETSRLLRVANTDSNIISTYRKTDNSLWSVQSYAGKVVKMNPSTLSIIKTFEGLDAPFKIRYSVYHNCYFVAGSHILWKIDDTANTVKEIYEVDNYSIRDFDVSESGDICLLLGGSGGNILRILHHDSYQFIFNQSISGNLRFCKYCYEGRFYILSEISGDSAIYSAVHYVFDLKNNTLKTVSSQNVLSVTTTTTTPGITAKAVQIQNPEGGEQIRKNSQYDIQWISSKSLSDFVKIELYKGTVLYSTLTEKTANTGIYSWSVASDIEDDDDYKIKITWLAISSDPNNYDIGGSFTISSSFIATTTTTTTAVTEHAIGIDYGLAFDQILIVLASGLYMIFDLQNMVAYGLPSFDIYGISAMATRSIVINGLDKQKAVRIFVGSAPYLSDKWDSGIVYTNLTSIYYGGGNNLKNGQTYYVHVQTYSEKQGWGEVQISSFVFSK